LLAAEACVDQHRVVSGRVKRARLGEAGRDVDLVPVGAERAADQRPHLVHIVDDEDSGVAGAACHRCQPSRRRSVTAACLFAVVG
jgi:hypothetical protein